MGLRAKFKAYGEYEAKEIARRALKKRKVKTYGALARAAKRKAAPKRPPLRMTARGITKAINNPYGTKFPKAKKALKKVKKRRRKRRIKTVVVYK